MKLAIIGTGYVGLVTGVGLAEVGHDVLCVDLDAQKVAALQAGKSPIYEPGLTELMVSNTKAGRLQFATAIPPDADVYFVCVGTPPLPDGSADVSAVLSVARDIAKSASVGRSNRFAAALVVIKSTVPAGTGDAVEALLGSRLEVVSNPEFLKEGDAINDFFRPDRIVIGANSASASARLLEVYAPLKLLSDRYVLIDRLSAELTKYASNAMLAMRVSFMNELSRLCHSIGADIHAVRLGVGSDTRIGKRFLYAGPGYGGSCFPKDVQALAHLGKQHGIPMRLAEATHIANQEQVAFVAKLVEDSLGDLRGKTIAFWGLAFKPGTDDVREAPSLALAAEFTSRGAIVVGHDPQAAANFGKATFGSNVMYGDRVRLESNPYDAVTGADALVLLTEWRSYRTTDFDEIKKRMRGDLIIDTRNVWERAHVTDAHLRYIALGTGRPS